MSTDLRARIGECRHLLERGEQAARLEAWDSLPGIQQSYADAFDGLRATLGDGPADEDMREQLAELERRQRRLVYEFRKGQAVIKARLEDLEMARQRLGSLGSELPLFITASVDRSA